MPTMQAKEIYLDNESILEPRTVVVEANYVIIVGKNGKNESIVPWHRINTIKLQL